MLSLDRRKFFVRRVKDKLRRTLAEILHPRLTRQKREHGHAQKALALDLIDAHYKLPRTYQTVTCIVFSKDRPLQLNALIQSYKTHLEPVPKILLTYGSSTESFKQAYEEVIARHRDVIVDTSYRQDSEFRVSFISLVHKVTTDALFFLVDDNIFTRPVPLTELLAYDMRKFVPSLRMHEKLSWCYNQFIAQPLPPSHSEVIQKRSHFAWLYKEGLYDWRYPLSLDGHLFDTQEIKTIIDHIEFSSPNSLELAMQVYNDGFLERFGVSFSYPVIINVPCNKIQRENDNPHAGTYHQKDLLVIWQKGLEIDVRKMENFDNKSAHQGDVNFSFIPRT